MNDRHRIPCKWLLTEEHGNSNSYKTDEEGYNVDESTLGDEKDEVALCEDVDSEEYIHLLCRIKNVQNFIPGTKVKYVPVDNGEMEIYMDNTIRINESCFGGWNNYAFYNKSGTASAYDFIQK